MERQPDYLGCEKNCEEVKSLSPGDAALTTTFFCKLFIFLCVWGFVYVWTAVWVLGIEPGSSGKVARAFC